MLVDEYQDSNVAQFELLRELWEPGIYLCVVGDDDQSIYRFRGAEVGNILSFPKVFPGNGGGAAGAQLPLHAGDPRCRFRGGGQQYGQAGQDALDRERARASRRCVACLEDQEEEADFCASIVA